MHDRKPLNFDPDVLNVLVLKKMNVRYDANGVELPTRDMGDLEVVHSTEIARYYGLDHHDVGSGDNRVPGVWSLVHGNVMGQRIAYNSEETTPGDRNVRDWKVIKDARGMPIDTEEVIKKVEFAAETDDGMYVRLSDLLKYAKVQGWTKGGGTPAKAAAAASADRLDRMEAMIEKLMAAVVIQNHPAAKK